jgi:dsRNA-specific ribonuclease
MELSNASTLKPQHTSTATDDPTTNGEKSNPIGKLQELTQKNWIRPPEYEFSDQENVSPANSKMYSCQAKVATYAAEGESIDGLDRIMDAYLMQEVVYRKRSLNVQRQRIC